ncbi:alpha/beta hydrolase family protein [Sphingomonas fuzhouensis]|uniref:alpha/beta hydrolase family protein n=1 Tax=Sphingomonas fuzhouensis TaxID=3106033 RepID=UPI002AFE95A8|nr:dienelactone hydrolase [Sphingomonas sp. SGZ-02]
MRFLIAMMVGTTLAGAAASNGIATTPDLDAPARPGIDAPELARLGRYPIGVTNSEFVQPRQADPLHGDERPAIADRHLPLTIWYPAAGAGRGIVYHTALSGEDGRDVPFDLPGLATADLPVAAGRFPLVILAHGYGNSPAVLSWLGENLASKGYVVVAPAFRDPPISIRTDAARAGPITRRPLDIAFVTAEAQRRAGAREGIFASVDPERTALIGYSMGGYGVLTVGGAPLNPRMADLSRGLLAPFAAGGAQADALHAKGVKAVVAIAPAARLSGVPLWTGTGAGAVAAPTLFIVGDRDRVVGYDAVRALFEAPAPAARYLLTFRQAGHSIALTGAPPSMRTNYWNFDWFEDAVWRKDRLLPIQAHFITAFLDRYVKGDRAMEAYLDDLTPDSDAGRWPDAPVGRVARYSPGPPAATVWKGFQPSRAIGMRFDYRP